MNKLLILLGPTAVGKTELSFTLAEKLEGEVVSADSRLFYRDMDIGTAKPTSQEMSRVRHHLIDIVNPNQTVTLGQYQRMAYAAIDHIHAQKKLPLLVGGTGQYIMAVAEGWGIPKVAPQPRLRQELDKINDQQLHIWLTTLDPITAKKIDYRNKRRVIRALEVVFMTGQPMSELQRKTPPPYDMCWLGLYRERSSLYARIDRRVDQMIENGLVSEVENLRNAGCGRKLPSMSGLGYRQIYAYLEGECSLDEAVDRIKFETHRFARQQYTWFRRKESVINWFNFDEDEGEGVLIQFAHDWMKN